MTGFQIRQGSMPDNQTPCSNFGHLAVKFKSYLFAREIFFFETIVNGLSVMKMFQFRIVILFFRSMPTVSTKLATSLGFKGKRTNRP